MFSPIVRCRTEEGGGKRVRKVYAILLAGGSGTRLGADIPKQYIKINNKPIIAYSLEMFAAHPAISGIQIVAEEAYRDEIRKWTDAGKLIGFSDPGENRQFSIKHAVCDLAKEGSEEDLILIHDSARPAITYELVDCMIEALGDYDGVMPVLPMQDTVYLSEDGKRVSALLNREQIFAGQAPELFRLGSYKKAMDDLGDEVLGKIRGTTEVAIKAGLDVTLVAGDKNNLKITTKEDLLWFEEYSHKLYGNI